MLSPTFADDPKYPCRETICAVVGAVGLVAVLVAIIGMAVAAEKASAVPGPRLTLLMEPAKVVVESAEDVAFAFRLVNTGDVAITVCTWPGIALASGYENSDGSVERFEPKPPHAAVLNHSDFKNLAPRESIAGTTSLHVFPTPVGYLRVHAKYRSGSDGARFRLNAWKGEVESRAIDIQVPRSTTE